MHTPQLLWLPLAGRMVTLRKVHLPPTNQCVSTALHLPYTLLLLQIVALCCALRSAHHLYRINHFTV